MTDDERTLWNEQLAYAQKVVDDIDKGVRHLIQVGDSPTADVTSSRRAHFAKAAERLEKFMAAHGAQE